MLHIIAAIKHCSDKITHLKVFDGYSMQTYDIATFVMLYAFPEYRAIEGHTDMISSEIQQQNIQIELTDEGIRLKGYSDLPVLNEKGKILHPGRVIFSKAGVSPVKAIQSGFKEVQCSPRDVDKKLVCNAAEYHGMLDASEYVLKWEDCYSRFEILFHKDIAARSLLSGINYDKNNRIEITSTNRPEISLLAKGILVDSTIDIRLEGSQVETIVLPVAAKQVRIELIDCPKLKQIICPYGTTLVKVDGAIGLEILRTTLMTEAVAKMRLHNVIALENAVDIKIQPLVVRDTPVL